MSLLNTELSIMWGNLRSVVFISQSFCLFVLGTMTTNAVLKKRSIKPLKRQIRSESSAYPIKYKEKKNVGKKRWLYLLFDTVKLWQLRNMSKTKTLNAKSNCYKESELKNPKHFWNKIKTIISTSDKHINKIRADNTIIHHSLVFAQTFNQYFLTVCSSLLPDSDISTSFSSHISACYSSFSFRKISPKEVQN